MAKPGRQAPTRSQRPRKASKTRATEHEPGRKARATRTRAGPKPAATGWLEHIDPPANDFVLLAAIGPSLRQFSMAS